MNIFILLPLLLTLGGVAILVRLAFRHLQEMQVMNVQTDARSKVERVKEELILQRLARLGTPMSFLRRFPVWAWKHVQRGVRLSVTKLHQLEAHYERLKQQAAISDATVVDLKKAMGEAAERVREGVWDVAERMYIEIISHNPRFAPAYEYLGRLYLKMKQYDQAVETLQFALKLHPKDASVQASLGEVYAAQDQWGKAFDLLAAAVEKRPGNPRYLDAYIEAALETGRAEEASRGVALLRQSNPENQKLAAFEERLAAMGKE